MTEVKAISTEELLDTIGVNTHFDFKGYGYEQIDTVIASIKYLSVRHLRDSSQKALDLTVWPRVSQETGAKFINYMAQGSEENMTNTAKFIPELVKAGCLEYIEGGNEEDSTYSKNLGNTIEKTVAFQKELWKLRDTYGLPVINMSFGAGWTWEDGYKGNYDATGDLSAWCDYGNAHTYPNDKQKTQTTIRRLNGLAKLAATSRPVITTEIGWDERLNHTPENVARHVLVAVFAGYVEGNTKTYFYSLYDDGSGKFGLMKNDGTPKPAGTSLHNLSALLADPKAKGFTPGSLGYSLENFITGSESGKHQLLMQKSNGDFWLALWDENATTPREVSVLVDALAHMPLDTVEVYYPKDSTSYEKQIKLDVIRKVKVTLTTSPVLLRIYSAVLPPNTVTSTKDNDTLHGDSGTTLITAGGRNATIYVGDNSSKPCLVSALKGGAVIYAGTGKSELRISGDRNKIIVGSSTVKIQNSGPNPTFVLGNGFAEILGYVLNPGTVFDLSEVLKQTKCPDKTMASIVNYFYIKQVGLKATLFVMPEGAPGPSDRAVMSVSGYANLSLTKLFSFATFC